MIERAVQLSGNEVRIGTQKFPVTDAPALAVIPRETLAGISLAELPDAIAIVPTPLNLHVVGGQRAECHLYCTSAQIRIVSEPHVAEPSQSLLALRQAVFERQKSKGDLELDLFEEIDGIWTLAYLVNMVEQVRIEEGLRQIEQLAEELNRRHDEILGKQSLHTTQAAGTS